MHNNYNFDHDRIINRLNNKSLHIIINKIEEINKLAASFIKCENLSIFIPSKPSDLAQLNFLYPTDPNNKFLSKEELTMGYDAQFSASITLLVGCDVTLHREWGKKPGFRQSLPCVPLEFKIENKEMIFKLLRTQLCSLDQLLLSPSYSNIELNKENETKFHSNKPL